MYGRIFQWVTVEEHYGMETKILALRIYLTHFLHGSSIEFNGSGEPSGLSIQSSMHVTPLKAQSSNGIEFCIVDILLVVDMKQIIQKVK